VSQPTSGLVDQRNQPFTMPAPQTTATKDQFCAGRPVFPPDIDAAGGTDLERWQTLVQRHGVERGVALVQGDFAVSLVLPDGRRLLAVDRFAIQTLCWRLDGSGLKVSQRADHIADGESLDAQALFDYLYFHVIPAPRTVFQGVHRLPAAHLALFDGRQVSLRRYWTPAFATPSSSPNFPSLREEFLELLKQSTQAQLDAGQPAACFLSGGTDSSTVAGMVGLSSGQAPTCYSIGFEAAGYDEMSYARMAAQHFGCEHREIYFTPAHLLQEIPRVAAWYDQPFGNSSAVPSFHAAQQAQADGFHRILAGDGGDELFGGNSRYATQRLFEHYQRVPKVLREAVLEPVFKQPAVAKLPLLRKGTSYIQKANTPLPDRGQDYNLVRRLGYEEVLSQDFLAQVDTASVDAQMREVWAQAHCDSELNRHLAFDWRYTLAECDLPKVVGTTAMAGLSVGFPMLDQRLVDFSMRLPMDYKLKGQALRWFFKEALRGFLPDGILTKKKQGFGLPFGVWMMQDPKLRQLADEALASVVARGMVRPAFVQRLMSQMMVEHAHYYGTMVWILVMMEHWMRQHAPNWQVPR